MRIAVLIIGLLVGLLLFLQSFTIGIFSDTSLMDDATATAGGTRLLMALIWLLASALIIPFPLVSTILYGISVPLGLFVPTGDFSDLRFHGFVAIVLTVMAFFGWRGKRKQDREKAEELVRQRGRDERLEMLLYRQQQAFATPSVAGSEKHTSGGKFCTSCGTETAPGEQFCGECGTPVRVAASTSSL